jgi:hypothetical protein
LLVLLTTAGCAGRSGNDEIYQYLDESTGVTVTSLAEPLAFFNDEPMLAANARDYVYIGPAELNRTGKREIVLWINFCSTIDRGRRFGSYRPDKVILMLDGKPMELAQANDRINVNEWSYITPVIGGSTIIYRVTRGQLRLLANAGDVQVLAEGDGHTRKYARWRSTDNGFQRFASYLDDEAQYWLTSVNERRE